MPWVDVNGSDIYYHEEGEGQPLVFLHGMTSCGEAWFQQFEAFRHRFRVIGYDSVNHGHSSNSPRDEPEPDRADELEGFLSALGIERPILAGNSMGGGTLLRWAARHPGDALAHPRRPTAANPSRGELAGLISKVTSPMLIVVGGLDRALPAAQYLHELVAGSRLTVIDGAPHNVYWEAA